MPLGFAFPYDPQTGAITCRLTCSRAEADLLPFHIFTTDPAASQIDDTTHHVVDGELVERERMALHIDKTEISADLVDTATIVGVPPGTIVRVLGLDPVQVGDGILEFKSGTLGTFRLEFALFPYRDTVLEVTAT